MGKHEPGKGGGTGREVRAQSSPQQNPIWAIAAIGGIVLVGIITALNIPLTGGKAALLEEQVQAQREREQKLGPAGRHKDIEIKIEDLRALRNDAGFANLAPAKQEYVRARLQGLLAYREYEKKLAAITDPKDVHNEEQLEHGRADLAELKVPAEYLVEWSDTEADVRHREFVADARALKSALEQNRKAYQDLIRDGKKVINTAAEANLPRRARDVLDRANALPHPSRDQDRLIPGSSRITYATVFNFPEVKILVSSEWKGIEDALKPLLDPIKP